MEITVDTKIVALLGKPLRQSLSSKMHSEAFALAGLNYIRIPMEVEGEHLEDVIKGLRYMNVAGISVTKPYKVDVIKYLDEMDELAQKIGAVNCIVNKNGRLKGYNTDGEGFVNALLQETDCMLEQTVFFSLGAGGAGRAICSTLAYRGAKKIYIADQYDDASAALVNDINKYFSPVAEKVPYGDKTEMRTKIAEANVIMNVTGLGMQPHLDETPIEKEALAPHQLAFDAIYNPAKTRFLREAESIGCTILNGQGMIVHCGMMGFELYTGVKQSLKTWSAIMAAIMKDNAG